MHLLSRPGQNRGSVPCLGRNQASLHTREIPGDGLALVDIMIVSLSVVAFCADLLTGIDQMPWLPPTIGSFRFTLVGMCFLRMDDSVKIHLCKQFEIYLP